jgi:hypothetical protein
MYSTRRRRGSAYVEALLVCSLLSLLWLGALGLGRLYGMKLSSLFGAREDAWRATAQACGPRSDELQRSVDALARTPDAPHGRAILQAAARISTRQRARDAVQSRARRLPFFGRERDFEVETTTHFACNEPVSAVATRSSTSQRFFRELLRGARP